LQQKTIYPGRSQVDKKVVAYIFPFFPAVWWLVGTDLTAAMKLVASTEKVAVIEPVAGMEKLAGMVKNSSVLAGWLGRMCPCCLAWARRTQKARRECWQI
jgi:hypothetical protein